MNALLKTTTWFSAVAAGLLLFSTVEVQAQVVRTTTTTTAVRANPNFYRPTVNVVRPAQPFPVTGNPYWYLNHNAATLAYRNPSNYVNYSYMYSAYNPYMSNIYSGYWGYNPYLYSGYNPYAYPTYNPYVYPSYNPYIYPASGYGVRPY